MTSSALTDARRPSRGRRHLLGRDPQAYILFAPAYLIYLGFVLVPALFVIVLSLTDAKLGGAASFVGLQNFVDMWSDSSVAPAIANTVTYSLGTIIPSLAIGLALAVALNSTSRASGMARLGFYLPNVVSMVAVSVAFLWIFDPTVGLLNQILRLFGFAGLQWLYDPALALPSLIVLGIWKSIGFNMIVYLAALKGVPRELHEAAWVDGATGWQTFRRVTFPLLQPTTFFLLVIGIINGFQVFDQIYVMTQGGPANSTTTLVHQVYLQAFFYQRLGFAAALSTFLMLIVAVLTLGNFRFGQGRMAGY